MLKKLGRKMLRGDPWIYIAVVFLIAFGTVMVGSAAIGNAAVSAATTEGVSGGIQSFITIAKQVVFVIFGIIALIITIALYDHSRINRRTAKIILLLMTVSLIVCRFFKPTNGSYAWIHLGSIATIQPSELCKIGLILLLSFYFTQFPRKLFPKKKSYYMQYKHGEMIYKKAKSKYRKYCWWLPLLVCLGEVAIVIGVQNDTGTALITAAICVVCFFLSPQKYYGKQQRLFLLTGLLVVALIPLGIIGYNVLINMGVSFLQNYQLARFSSWLDPLSSPYGNSAQLANSLVAITKGKFFGVGLFNSTQKFGFIPEVETDFITSLVLEEFGLVGLAMIIIPYSVIIFRLVRFGIRSKSDRSSIVLIGIASYFFLHLFINLGGVSGLIPMTGVPLIFVSQGGSSVLAGSIAIGLAQATIAMDKVNERKARKRAVQNG